MLCYTLSGHQRTISYRKRTSGAEKRAGKRKVLPSFNFNLNNLSLDSYALCKLRMKANFWNKKDIISMEQAGAESLSLDERTKLRNTAAQVNNENFERKGKEYRTGTYFT